MAGNRAENAERWLTNKGWFKSGHWWLPPSGLRYKAKCYQLREAVRTEATLSNVSEVAVYTDTLGNAEEGAQ